MSEWLTNLTCLGDVTIVKDVKGILHRTCIAHCSVIIIVIFTVKQKVDVINYFCFLNLSLLNLCCLLYTTAIDVTCFDILRYIIYNITSRSRYSTLQQSCSYCKSIHQELLSRFGVYVLFNKWQCIAH